MSGVGTLPINRELTKNTSVVGFNFTKTATTAGTQANVKIFWGMIRNKTTTPTNTNTDEAHSYNYTFADSSHNPFTSDGKLGDGQVVSINNTASMYNDKTYENIHAESFPTIDDITLQVTTAFPVSVIAHYMKKIANDLNYDNKLTVTNTDNKISYCLEDDTKIDISEVANDASDHRINQSTKNLLNARNATSATLDAAQRQKTITITNSKANPILWAHIAHLAAMNAKQDFTTKGELEQTTKVNEITTALHGVYQLEHELAGLNEQLTKARDQITTAEIELGTLKVAKKTLETTKNTQTTELKTIDDNIKKKTKEKDLDKIKSKNEQQSKNIGKLEAEIEQLNKDKTTKQEEIENTTSKNTAKETEIKNQEEKIHQFTGSVNTLNKQIATTNNTITTANSNITPLWTQLATLEGQYGLDKTVQAIKQQEIKNAWEEENPPPPPPPPPPPTTATTTNKSKDETKNKDFFENLKENSKKNQTAFIIGGALLAIVAVCYFGFPMLRNQLKSLAPQ